MAAASCGEGRSASTSIAATTGPGVHPPITTTTLIDSTTTTVTEQLTISVKVSPDHIDPETVVTFTVEIRGQGTGIGEGVRFGDGGTSGQMPEWSTAATPPRPTT